MMPAPSNFKANPHASEPPSALDPEESRVLAAIALLESRGYRVIPPSKVETVPPLEIQS